MTDKAEQAGKVIVAAVADPQEDEDRTLEVAGPLTREQFAAAVDAMQAEPMRVRLTPMELVIVEAAPGYDFRGPYA